MPQDPNLTSILCSCGEVAFEAAGEPIVCLACYCDDCQAGGRQVEALPGAPGVVQADGSTELVLFRDDRFKCVKGEERVKRYKLRPGSPTNRLVASCCNTALGLDFDSGPFWVSAFRSRIQGPLPPVQVRIQTRFAPEAAVLPTDAPTYRRFNFGLIARLMGVKAAMVLGR